MAVCRTIGPLLSQRLPLASAKAQPRGGDLLTMKCQWTYGPTLLPWFDHFHTSLACFKDRVNCLFMVSRLPGVSPYGSSYDVYIGSHIAFPSYGNSNMAANVQRHRMTRMGDPLGIPRAA